MEKGKKIQSQFQVGIKKLTRNKMAIVGACMMLIIIIASIIAPVLTPYAPDGIDLGSMLMSPGREHLFGTDKLGRDVFTRILFGGRTSILIGLTSAVSSCILGIILGALCGFSGGKLDKILLRVSEVFMSFPQILMVLLLVALIGQGLLNLIIVFTITGWVSPYRLVRGRYMSLREENYVEACRAFGIGKISIMFRHILPNTLGPIVVNISALTAMYILSESALSFLGLGVPSSVVTWGNILNAAKEVLTISKYPWLWIPAGLAISLFVLAVNFFGDGLRDVFDPVR